MTPFALFDDARASRAILLQDFVNQDILTPDTLSDLDACLQRGWAQNLHCAFGADYEFGLPLQRLPAHGDPASGSLKLHWFTQKHILDDAQTWLDAHAGDEPAGISTPEWNLDAEQYAQHIHAIHEAIRRGDTYQINHTLRLRCRSYGNPIRLYARLRQQVPYAALIHYPDNTWTLCFSPELFLRIEASGRISTEPMKGTAPILGDGQDNAHAQALRQDPKNRAENTMIVDLLRNDLGKLAQIGSVSVPAPFTVSAFGNVWQMTSTVVAQMKPGTSAAQIIQATFPCGSITGAPKRKSMEIINTLEDTPRQRYTGSIGFLEPAPHQALGFSGCLNVVIRTLQLTPAAQPEIHHATYGVGSGIVADSNADDEYAECGWKARFLTQLRPEFGLFETMRAEHGTIAWQAAHLNRLANSAHALNIPFDRNQAEQLLAHTLGTLPRRPHRIRLDADASGTLHIRHAELTPLPPTQTVCLHDRALPDHAPLRRHKTTHRAEFDRAWQQAAQQQAFDALIFNQSGFLLEGGRSSVLIRLNGQWLTPHPDLDILPGIALAQISGSLKPQAAYITRDMLHQAETIRIGNALRGWFDVHLLDNPSNRRTPKKAA